MATTAADVLIDTLHDWGSKRNIPHHTSNVFARGVQLPNADDVQRAAELLNAGKKIAILVAQGALGATDELEQVAENLGTPIIKALLGKAAVPDDSPYTTAGIGLLGTKPSQQVIEACDTLFMIGTSDEAANLAEALTRGEPNRENIALNVAREKMRELI